MENSKRTIAIVCGGDSSEHDVSLRSGQGLYSFFDKERYNIYLVDVKGTDWHVALDNGETIEIDKNDFSFVMNGKHVYFDYAYITIHGQPGENGVMQGYFDLIHLPYSTSGVLVEAMTFDKYVLNNYLRGFGINVADSILLRRGEAYDEEEIAKRIGMPCFVKPAADGSSFGVSKVKNADQLLRRDLDAKLLEDGLIHVRWNEKPLCSVDRDGIVRFRPADITGSEVDRQLRTVIQTAGHVKEYMRIFERAPTLKVVGLDDTYKVLADFGDAVLAGRSCKTGAKFVTWEWDFDRQGVHAGHYFMENYEAAKQDFAVRAGLVESQRLFSDEQIAVIKNACEFALEDDATLSYAEEKQLQSVQEQIERLLPQQEQEQRPTMEQTM